MQLQNKTHYYTPEEYLALEEQGEYKSEYHNGEIIPMRGTTNHNEISLNLVFNLKLSLKKNLTKYIWQMFVCGYLNTAYIPIPM